MNIAIVDDLPMDRALLLEHLNLYTQNTLTKVSVQTFSSGEEFLQDFSPSTFDVIFLDIMMGTVNGIEVARQVRALDPTALFIFISSSNAFAAESYQVNALHYLAKPYSYEQFAHVMDQATQTVQLASLFIEVTTNRESIRIQLENIHYVDYSNHCVLFHTTQGIVRTYSVGFPEVQDTLTHHSNFICCCKNIVVNMDCVSKIEGKDFILFENVRVPISRANFPSVKRKYSDYIFGKIRGNAQ